MKEIKVLYKDYKNSNKYSTLKKKNDSYDAANKTIVLLLDEYEEKAMEYLENNEDDRNISEIAVSIKYHIEFTTEEELLQRIENKIDDIEGEDEEESWVKEQKLHIQLFRYILEKHWLNFEEVPTMKKFEIRKGSIEVSWKDREKIEEGITLTGVEQYPEIVASFDELEKAKEELKKYKSSITEMSSCTGIYYLVEEFYVEENDYDEEGEWIEGGYVWEFSKITIRLVEQPSYSTLATFDNMKDAVKAYNDYEGENKVYLSFAESEEE